MSSVTTRRNALLSAVSAAALAGCGQSAAEPQETKKGSAVEFVKNEILMLVYPRFTALDLIGPQHVFALLGPGYKTRLVWKNTDEVMSDTGVPIRPTLAFKDCPDSPAVLFIPGGTEGTIAALEDREVREFVARIGEKARFVTSVCTGSLVLGAAGLLKDYKATCHWLALNDLQKFGAEPTASRVVQDRNRITGAGVTAGIDFALTLAAQLQDEDYAKSMQLMMEYDPQPPFESGNPTVASKESVQLLEAMAAPFHSDLDAAIDRMKAQ